MIYEHLCKGCFTKKGSLDVCPFCGFDERKYIAPSFSLPLGQVLNSRYIVGRVLGSGGFGMTYIAYDTKLEYVVAIKEYLPKGLAQRSSDSVSVSSQAENTAKEFHHYMDSFIKEAKILAKFSNESGIVSVQDIFKENGTAYIVMYYVDGLTLEEYITKNGNRLPVNKAVEVMTVIMESLKKVHEAGVIHRDISPDNIYLTPDNKIKLLDFGAARYFVGDDKSTVSVVIKRGYAPLEQYYNKKESQGPWTDIYSIAATMYRAITGVKPPDALERMDADELKAPNEMGIKIPSHIESAIMKGLNLKYTERYKTLDDFIKQLEPVAQTEIITEVKALPKLKAKYKNIKMKALALMGAAVILLAVSITYTLIEKGNSSVLNNKNAASSQGRNDLALVSATPEAPLDDLNGTADGLGNSENQSEPTPDASASQTPVASAQSDASGANATETGEPPSSMDAPVKSSSAGSAQTPSTRQTPAATPTPNARQTPSPTPTPKPSATNLKMPDFRNRSLIDSIAELTGYNIEYQLKYAYSKAADAGKVIMQSIPAGQTISSNIVITLTVSLGEMEDSTEPSNIIHITQGITVTTDMVNRTQTISMYKDQLPAEMPEIINVCIVSTDSATEKEIVDMAAKGFQYSFQYNGRSGTYYRFNDDDRSYVVLLLYDSSDNFIGYFSYENPLKAGQKTLTQPDNSIYNKNAVLVNSSPTHVRSNVNDIYVVSVEPAKGLKNGDNVTMTVTFEYNLISQASANINICVNNGGSSQGNLENTRLLVPKGRGTYTLTFPTVVKYWSDGAGVIVNAYISKSDNSTICSSNKIIIPIMPE